MGDLVGRACPVLVECVNQGTKLGIALFLSFASGCVRVVKGDGLLRHPPFPIGSYFGSLFVFRVHMRFALRRHRFL